MLSKKQQTFKDKDKTAKDKDYLQWFSEQSLPCIVCEKPKKKGIMFIAHFTATIKQLLSNY